MIYILKKKILQTSNSYEFEDNIILKHIYKSVQFSFEKLFFLFLQNNRIILFDVYIYFYIFKHFCDLNLALTSYCHLHYFDHYVEKITIIYIYLLVLNINSF